MFYFILFFQDSNIIFHSKFPIHLKYEKQYFGFGSNFGSSLYLSFSLSPLSKFIFLINSSYFFLYCIMINNVIIFWLNRLSSIKQFKNIYKYTLMTINCLVDV